MPRPTGRYLLLALLCLPAAINYGGNAWNAFRLIGSAAQEPDEPFSLRTATRTIANGPLAGDQILAIDGRPFNRYAQFLDAVNSRRPGDQLRLTLSEPSGHATEKLVEIPSRESDYSGAAKIAIVICFDVAVPLAALLLGFGAAFVRPRDSNAWFLLFLMMSFTESARHHTWRALGADTTFLWSGVWTLSWPIWMLLFGVRFPERIPIDRKRPWIKYLIVVPAALSGAIYCIVIVVWLHSLSQAAHLHSLWQWNVTFNRLIGIAGISGFFACVGYRLGTEKAPDARRRLRTLMFGASVSLSPMFLLVLYSLATSQELFSGVPWELTATAILFLALFPLTLAYVVVVDRAMDLGFVIRQSVQYGVVRTGLWLARAALVIIAVFIFQAAATRRAQRVTEPIELTLVGIALLVLRGRASKRASDWVDRKFFREAYDAEKVLTDLAGEVGSYLEFGPLITRVTNRISEILHVPDIVVLMREGESFVTRHSTRPGEPMDLPSDSRIVHTLRADSEPLQVYLERPAPWMRQLTGEDLQALDFMRTQLLLPVSGNDGLTAIISLGPKLSEAPYTPTDVRLLRAVASQMALALDNTRLAASLAAEAAHRERATRELEIAREVQERLFPQRVPMIPGLDCAGYCRPARGVGGDYYDFLPEGDDKLGIAIGDVSGKGIAAALLMASLQASLRGQALAGVQRMPELMSNVNKLVYEASTSNRYATFFYAEYHFAARSLIYVNAGHNAPFVLRGEEVIRLEATGPVVGLLPGARYESGTYEIREGDIFVGYTDGISEAQNESEEEWEEERFIRAARECSSLPARQMIDSLFRAADAFTGNAAQFDDMTLLVIKFERIP